CPGAVLKDASRLHRREAVPILSLHTDRVEEADEPREYAGDQLHSGLLKSHDQCALTIIEHVGERAQLVLLALVVDHRAASRPLQPRTDRRSMHTMHHAVDLGPGRRLTARHDDDTAERCHRGEDRPYLENHVRSRGVPVLQRNLQPVAHCCFVPVLPTVSPRGAELVGDLRDPGLSFLRRKVGRDQQPPGLRCLQRHDPLRGSRHPRWHRQPKIVLPVEYPGIPLSPSYPGMAFDAQPSYFSTFETTLWPTS